MSIIPRFPFLAIKTHTEYNGFQRVMYLLGPNLKFGFGAQPIKENETNQSYYIQ